MRLPHSKVFSKKFTLVAVNKVRSLKAQYNALNACVNWVWQFSFKIGNKTSIWEEEQQLRHIVLENLGGQFHQHSFTFQIGFLDVLVFDAFFTAWHTLCIIQIEDGTPISTIYAH